MYRKDLVRQVMGGGRAQRAYLAGRDKQALDTDDGFRQAAALFAEAHGADADDPLPLAALAETDAQWGWYLREDAHALESAGGQGAQAAQAAAAALRREAQGHLDDAKRAASDALAIDPDLAEVNRAMADFLRVDGAPAAEVERYLKRATEKAPADADAAFVAGALSFREGQADAARTQLDQALKEAQAAGRPLFRASYLQAKLALQAGRKDEARTLLQGIVSANAQHERAKALLAQLETAVADAGAVANAPDLAVAAAKPVATPTPTPTPAPAPVAAATPAPAPATAPVAAKPADYNKIVQQADKLSENGKTDKARKLYEEALVANPQGVEAITGLGYCDLDKEKFLSAIDRFRQALNVSPDYGDALMGIAEAYKVQGNKPQAIEFYRRYLKAQPHGPKATMAQKNLRDLEPREHGLEPAEAPAQQPLPRLPSTPSDDTPPPPP
jgi:tetratricopeptide (TPR) repeat protein